MLSIVVMDVWKGMRLVSLIARVCLMFTGAGSRIIVKSIIVRVSSFFARWILIIMSKGSLMEVVLPEEIKKI